MVYGVRYAGWDTVLGSSFIRLMQYANKPVTSMASESLDRHVKSIDELHALQDCAIDSTVLLSGKRQVSFCIYYYKHILLLLLL